MKPVPKNRRGLASAAVDPCPPAEGMLRQKGKTLGENS
jgi:hypothetical protein